MENHIYLIILLTVLVSGCTHTTQSSKEDHGYIYRVVDGDTPDAEVRNENITIRLNGVDTPEVHAENTPKEWVCNLSKEHLRNYGEESSKFVKDNYSKVDVRIVYKGNCAYGRTLVSIYRNGTSLEKQLLQKGLEQTYGHTDFEGKSRFQQIVSVARREKEGIWSGC
jgi:micrococcal nuclease